MRKLRVLLAAIFTISATVAIAVPASAQDRTWLHEPHENTACPPGTAYGIWHFVNNQTDGSITTGIWIKDENNWSSPWHPLTSANKKVRHFWVVGPTVVKKAYVNAPGKLVLSWYDCVPGCTPG